MNQKETHLLIAELEQLCLAQRCHPSELKSYVGKLTRTQKRWQGQQPAHLLLETQRNLAATFPQGWL